MTVRRTHRIQDLRLVVDYIRAIRNEVAIDKRTLAMTGMNPHKFGKIPRPSRWIGLARRIPALSRWIQYISLPVWYLAAPLLFWAQRRGLDKNVVMATRPSDDRLGHVLGLSNRAMDIVHSRHITPLPSLWLELPWIPLESIPPGAEVVRAVDLLCDADLHRVDTLARLAHRALQRRRGLQGWGLQTYTAWRWFFARVVIDKLPGPLLTVEHFDRWAVLVDASIWASRIDRPERRLTLMQHGSVNAETPEQTLKFSLPTRLRAVDRLHVYSPDDEGIFRREILSKNCNRGDIEVTYFRSLITLLPVENQDTPSLLFVGHPLCENAHIALMRELMAVGGVQCFYKPHPTIGASKRIPKLPWTVVQDRAVFPRVNVIVSYPSTMVAEYAAHGVPAVVHPMDISSMDGSRLAQKVLDMIKTNWSAVRWPLVVPCGN
jgi:hypothetical protein